MLHDEFGELYCLFGFGAVAVHAGVAFEVDFDFFAGLGKGGDGCFVLDDKGEVIVFEVREVLG